MFKTNFYLKETHSEKETLIYLFLSYNGKRSKMSTGLKILPALWNSNDQKVDQSKKTLFKFKSIIPGIQKQQVVIQRKLDEIKKEVNSYCLRKMAEDMEPCLKELKIYLKNKIESNPEASLKGNIVIAYLSEFIKEAKSGNKLMPGGKRYQLSTLQCYTCLKNGLEGFEKDKKIKVEWDSIDRQFYDDFVIWNELKGYKPTYTGKRIKVLKAIMRLAYDDGLHTNRSYEARWFHVHKERAKRTALTYEEVQLLFNYELQHGTSDCTARDFFMLGVFLGMRAGDLKRIKKDMFFKTEEGNTRVRLKTEKTGKEVTIPVSSDLAFILEKYDYQCPNMSEQSVNRKIKQIAEDAGIDRHKATNLSLHIGRYTFATYLYTQGLPIGYIMYLTGHTTERNFMNYIDIRPDEAAGRMEQHSFFQ